MSVSKKGDLVATRNPKTGKSEFKQVEHAFVKTATKIAIVSLMDARTHHRVETLRGTLEHPFFTTQGTVPMGQLKPGMKVISRRGPPLVVQSVHRQGYPHGIAVYNFQVADDHSYFVGSAHGGTWVHNAGPECSLGTSRTFTSKDPLVDDIANSIESRYPGHVVGVNTNLGGYEVDILTQNAIIEVKTGGSGLTRQVSARQSLGLPVIGYSPSLGTHGIRSINSAGGIGTNNLHELLDVVKP